MPDATPHGDVTWWIDGDKDATFSRLHCVVGVGESRREFAARFALDNVATSPVGMTSHEQGDKSPFLLTGAGTLPERIGQLKPSVIWLATVAGRPYAKPIIERLGVRVIMTNNPCDQRNISDAEIQDVWDQLFPVIHL